jgi:hypothetical protein
MNILTKQRIAILILIGFLPIPSSYAINVKEYLSTPSEIKAKNEKNALLANPNQYSITLAASQTISTLVANFYLATDCSGTPTDSISMVGGDSTMNAITYTSTDASNYALCQAYSGGCTAAQSDNGAIQFVYNFTWGAFTAECFPVTMQNSSSGACTSSTDCGFSAPASDTLHNSGQLFVTVGTNNGQFTTSSANAVCASEASGVLSGTYTALYNTSSSNWNLMPSANYYTVSEVNPTIATDSSSFFTSTVLAYAITQADGSLAGDYWTGSGFTYTCNSWTDGTAGFFGEYGTPSAGTSSWFAIGNDLCNVVHSFLCVSYNY